MGASRSARLEPAPGSDIGPGRPERSSARHPAPAASVQAKPPSSGGTARRPEGPRRRADLQCDLEVNNEDRPALGSLRERSKVLLDGSPQPNPQIQTKPNQTPKPLRAWPQAGGGLESTGRGGRKGSLLPQEVPHGRPLPPKTSSVAQRRATGHWVDAWHLRRARHGHRGGRGLPPALGEPPSLTGDGTAA